MLGQMLPTPSCVHAPVFLLFCFLLSFFSDFQCFVFLHPDPFIHLAFILVIPVFWWDWFKRGSNAASAEGLNILYLLFHSSRSIAAFNGASARVNAVCFPLITCPWTWLKSPNICVCVCCVSELVGQPSASICFLKCDRPTLVYNYYFNHCA